MNNLALQHIQKMKLYSPPLSGRSSFDGVLLDFNERTTPAFQAVRKAMSYAIQLDATQRYPEYGSLDLAVANYVGVAEKNILLTNGSDQGIDIIFRTFVQSGDSVIIPTPTFAMFAQSAQIIGANVITPHYDSDTLAFPFDAVLASITAQVKLIVLCNPNNPTGTVITADSIAQIAESAPQAIILVDEAYFEYAAITAVPLIQQYPNIIVLRTFSKAFGLAALRIGYVVASEIYVRELQKVRGPYDINMIAYLAAQAALKDTKRVQQYVTEVMKKAKPMVESFFAENGICYYASSANFILYNPMRENEAELLADNGFLVRPQNKLGIEKTIRLTIGTEKQMKRCINVYKQKIFQDPQSQKYAFIDRDGTLIFEPQDTYQIDSLEKLQLLDGVIAGLQALLEQNYRLILVSNQDGLGTASFPKEDFENVQNAFLKRLAENSIAFEQIYICPHKPEKQCGCRKPKTGLVKKFLRENQMDMKASFVCGDRENDKAFAENLKIKFVPMQTNTDFSLALKTGGIIS